MINSKVLKKCTMEELQNNISFHEAVVYQIDRILENRYKIYMYLWEPNYKFLNITEKMYDECTSFSFEFNVDKVEFIAYEDVDAMLLTESLRYGKKIKINGYDDVGFELGGCAKEGDYFIFHEMEFGKFKIKFDDLIIIRHEYEFDKLMT